MIILTSCTANKQNYGGEIISDIEILTQGNISRNDAYAQYLCKNFTLTKEQVRNYYFQSRVSSNREIHDNFNLLSCYSTGTININGEKFMWKIRAGGGLVTSRSEEHTSELQSH